MITVTAEVPDGPPACFSWRRVTRRVKRAEGPERIEPEWWHLIGRSGPAPVSAHMRDYYRVEDEHGGAYWIYRAGCYPTNRLKERDAAQDSPDIVVGPPTWYLHGLF